MVLKIAFKQQRLKRPMYSKLMTYNDCFCDFHKHKTYPFSVLPVCMQEFLILILKLPFSICPVFCVIVLM